MDTNETNETTAAGCCRLGQGLHYRSAEWLRLAEAGCWSDCWPEIDRDGLITGRTIGDEPGFLNVGEEAMIAEDEARAGGWTIDEDDCRAEPRPVLVEIATADETIRICGGLEEFAGLEHTAISEACEAYNRAATAALDGVGRLHPVEPRGQRLLHSAWMGAKWGCASGAVATMATDLTEDEKAAISAADDAGREAARKVISAADAADAAVEARLESRPVEGTGWYVYVGGADAGGPFETEADALAHWQARS